MGLGGDSFFAVVGAELYVGAADAQDEAA